MVKNQNLSKKDFFLRYDINSEAFEAAALKWGDLVVIGNQQCTENGK